MAALRGAVGHVGQYCGVPTVWVDFDDGHTKALALEFGLPHLTLEVAPERRRGPGWRRH